MIKIFVITICIFVLILIGAYINNRFNRKGSVILHNDLKLFKNDLNSLRNHYGDLNCQINAIVKTIFQDKSKKEAEELTEKLEEQLEKEREERKKRIENEKNDTSTNS